MEIILGLVGYYLHSLHQRMFSVITFEAVITVQKKLSFSLKFSLKIHNKQCKFCLCQEIK